MKYSIGDFVKFYPNVNTNQVFIGKITDLYMGMNQYKVLYEGSKYCIHEQFIIGTASADEIKIARFELTISEKDLMIQELSDKIDKLVGIAISDGDKLDNFCKDKAALEVLLADCHKNLEKAHREIADLKFKLRKCESEKIRGNWDNMFKNKPIFPPLRKRVPWSINCGDKSKSGCCSVKSGMSH